MEWLLALSAVLPCAEGRLGRSFRERGVADVEGKLRGVTELLGGERFCPTSSERMTEMEKGFLGVSPLAPMAAPPPPPPPGGLGGVWTSD